MAHTKADGGQPRMADERTVEPISITKRFGTTVAVDSVGRMSPGGRSVTTSCPMRLPPDGTGDARLLQAA
jgi:hypothetical protein